MAGSNPVCNSERKCGILWGEYVLFRFKYTLEVNTGRFEYRGYPAVCAVHGSLCLIGIACDACGG